MKKDWLQVLSLVLCAVLLLMVFSLRRELEDLRSSVDSRLDQLSRQVENTQSNVRDVSNTVREASRQVEDFRLEPAGLDDASKSLLAELSVTLKQWREDTAVTMTANLGQNTWERPMESSGAGAYKTTLELPVENGTELPAENGTTLHLELRIHSGGETSREELGDWGNIAMLLPVQLGGHGGNVPGYQQGLLVQNGYSVDLQGPNDEAVSVQHPMFRLYRNDELAWEQAASGTKGTYECPDWKLDYASGDTVEMTFACTDQFGLGYEFLLDSWNFDGETADNRNGASGGTGGGELVLSWPE